MTMNTMTLTTEKRCECGCGQPTPVADRTDTAKGYIKDRPLRFIKGHNNRLRIGEQNPRWLDEAEVGRSALHHWLRKELKKTGICEECSREVGPNGHLGTHFAFRFHGQMNYTRNRDDYRELCPACHMNFDRELIEAGRRKKRQHP
jgi:hypothetical protein